MAQRFNEARKKLGYSQVQFADVLGIKQGTVSGYESGKTQPSADILQRLSKLGFSIDWLMASDLPAPSVDNLSTSPQAPPDLSTPPAVGGRVAALRATMQLSQTKLAQKADISVHTIIRLEQGKHTTNRTKLAQIAAALGTNIDYLRFGTGEPVAPLAPPKSYNISVENKPTVTVAYLPVPARATFAESFNDLAGLPPETIEISADLIPPGVKPENVRAFDINGDSMEPRLQSGWRVLGRVLEREKWRYAPSGFYAVCYGSSTFVVKKIIENDLATGTLKLHSENPQGGTTTVAEQDILSIWQVFKVLSYDLHL